MKISNFYKLLIILATITFLTSACSKQSSLDHDDEVKDIKENPFKGEGDETVVMGALNHGFSNPKIDNNGEMIPLTYNGGELKIDYLVNASGKAKNIGFLIFIDGLPQPYKINSEEESYEFLHVMDLAEDNKDMPLSFIFTPITGKKGDTLSVSISSIYNPSFIPDMKETSSYGGYHVALEAVSSLVFQQDPDTTVFSKIKKNQSLIDVSLYKELVTNEMLDKELIDLDRLDHQVFTGVYSEDEEKMENIQINDDGSLKVKFKIFGHPNVRYRNTFYINHKPVSSKEGSSFETEVTKGNMSIIDVNIDVKDLEDFNTFYVVSVPINANDFPDDVIVLEKTPSILLYR
ncbi:beta-glucanase/beta-glucan synthetase [Lysinibacillus sp. NPDC093190]|uniref:beta-glucanase/beta-glucan synthetase n=1 Tax=Lysinibacillus sp. NPDC093190 TaxID=3390575 RepID=UPI003D086D3A